MNAELVLDMVKASTDAVALQHVVRACQERLHKLSHPQKPMAISAPEMVDTKLGRMFTDFNRECAAY